MQKYWQNYIDGKWCDRDQGNSRGNDRDIDRAGRLTVINPSNGEALAEIAVASPRDMSQWQFCSRQTRQGTLPTAWMQQLVISGGNGFGHLVHYVEYITQFATYGGDQSVNKAQGLNGSPMRGSDRRELAHNVSALVAKRE